MRGVYATKVSGQLPDDVRTQLEEEYRITYIPYVIPLMHVMSAGGLKMDG